MNEGKKITEPWFLILFAGGSGFGAAANVTSVDANGAITAISYVYPTGGLKYPLGGFGYRADALPSVTVSSVGGTDASIYVPGILGDGATFSTVVDRVGSVSTITLTNPGEDYISTPNVSIKVQDILVSNVSLSELPMKGDYIYQGGDINTASYIARVDSVSLLETNIIPQNSKYNLRVFNYNSNPNNQLKLVVQDKNINFIPSYLELVSIGN